MTEEEKNLESAAPIKPVELGGTVYLISQPTESMNASIGVYIVERLSKKTSPLSLIANDPAFRLLPVQAQVEVAREAAKAQVAGNPTVDAAAMLMEMKNPEALAFIFWILARGNHPGLRLEEIRPLITEANAAEIFVRLNEASGMKAAGEAAGN